MLLAIDTSLSRPALALAEGGRLLGSAAAACWPAALLDLLGELLVRLGHQRDAVPGELAAVAVATGPGRYTSLRSGVAFAKGLVAARGLRLIGVPTVAAVAAAAGLDHGSVLIPAGRGRLYRARLGGGEERIVGLEVADIAAAIGPGECVAGDIGCELVKALERVDARPKVVTPEASVAAVARLAQSLLDGAAGPATWGAAPRYVAPPATAASPTAGGRPDG